jgi:DNA-binding transcriptional MerR regulator
VTEGEDQAYRIGEVAERVGVTTRTIRYYEELGLLGGSSDRAKGAHRTYTEANVSRLQELIRLRDLLGLSLDELVELAEAEEARSFLCEAWDDSTDAERLRILDEAIPLVELQLQLVRARQQTLRQFTRELEEKLQSMHAKRVELQELGDQLAVRGK